MACWLPGFHPQARDLTSEPLVLICSGYSRVSGPRAGHLTGPVSFNPHKQLCRKALNFSPLEDGETEAPEGVKYWGPGSCAQSLPHSNWHLGAGTQ